MPYSIDSPSSALFPRHHRVFIITSQPSLCSLHSPLIFLVYTLRFTLRKPSLFHLFSLISTHLSALGPFCASKTLQSIYAVSILMPYWALSFKLFLFVLLCCQFLFLSLPPSTSSSYSLCSVLVFFSLLTVSRALVLNNLSNPLTSGSIVCPQIITYHLPSINGKFLHEHSPPLSTFIFRIPCWSFDRSEMQFVHTCQN